jgi:hypothetical protein
VASTTLLLATGETLEVAGSLDEVAKRLENATRSGAGTFAWVDEAASGERVGIRPAHVVLIRTTGTREA